MSATIERLKQAALGQEWRRIIDRLKRVYDFDIDLVRIFAYIEALECKIRELEHE